mmetsp:Transcript_25789/g.71862  ORF Transcript_25789/g.71862 Transcript_25789/m.71862 type:complete len:229 (+) Transcript_25789:116-802(+)
MSRLDFSGSRRCMHNIELSPKTRSEQSTSGFQSSARGSSHWGTKTNAMIPKVPILSMDDKKIESISMVNRQSCMSAWFRKSEIHDESTCPTAKKSSKMIAMAMSVPTSARKPTKSCFTDGSLHLMLTQSPHMYVRWMISSVNMKRAPMTRNTNKNTKGIPMIAIFIHFVLFASPGWCFGFLTVISSIMHFSCIASLFSTRTDVRLCPLRTTTMPQTITNAFETSHAIL